MCCFLVFVFFWEGLAPWDSPANTPQKLNSSPLKRGNPKRKLIFQPSFFRGYVKFRGCKPRFIWESLYFFASSKAHLVKRRFFGPAPFSPNVSKPQQGGDSVDISSDGRQILTGRPSKGSKDGSMVMGSIG